MDPMAKGQYLEKKADRKLHCCCLFASKYEDAAELYNGAATSFKLAKSWDRAALVYVKLANCHLKSDCNHEVARAYLDAANCYKKTSCKKAITCLDKAVDMFLQINRVHMAAKYCKEIGELYEQQQQLDKGLVYFERAADLFGDDDAATSKILCKQKFAQFSAQLGNYSKAIELYEEIARQSINDNLLKYGVRGHLLSAGLCQLCSGDVVRIQNALERYQDLDPTFSRTRECLFLIDLAAAMEEEDVIKFTNVVKEFDQTTPLEAWRTSILLRVKKALKVKEAENDLT